MALSKLDMVMAKAASIALSALPSGLFTADATGRGKFASGFFDHSLAPSGSRIGIGYAAYTANADLSGTIANDDSIPQSNEGSEIVSVAYTVKRADSLLLVTFDGFAVSGTAAIDYTVALFRDGVADALKVWNCNQTNNANYRTPLYCRHVFEPGEAGEITLSIRIGNHSGSTFRLNGSMAGRLWGGAAGALLTVEEIKA